MKKIIEKLKEMTGYGLSTTLTYEEALEVIKALEENQRLREALQEISEGKGRYDLDRFTHARNTIEDMKEIAVNALKQ